MGCGGSKAGSGAAYRDGNKTPPNNESSFVRRSEATPWSVPGESSSTRPKRQRANSLSIADRASQSALAMLDDWALPSNRAMTRGRSRSLAGAEAAVRVHGWVVAKEDTKGEGRKAGRIAVRAEGNIELRTQLAQHQGKIEHFTPEEATFVLEALGEHFLFKNMSVAQKTRMLQYMQRRKVAAKEVLVKQGEEGAREMFLVHTGRFEVHVKKSAGEQPMLVAVLNRSAVLGEMALLYACKRTATVTNAGTGDAEVLSLSREAYQLVLMGDDSSESAPTAKDSDDRSADDASSEQLALLRAVGWIQDLVPAQARKDVAKTLLEISVRQDATLLQPGHVAAVLLVIVSGSVNFQGDPSKKTRDGGMWRDSALGELCSDAVLSAGDVIALGRPGDEGMLAQFHAMSSTSQGKLRCLGGTHHQTVLTTREPTKYIAIPLRELLHNVGPHANIIGSPEGRRTLLHNARWSEGLSKKDIDALSFALRPGVYAKGDVLITAGERPKYVHLLVSGSVSVRRQRDGREALAYTALSGDVLGERELASDLPSPSTATADSDTFCLLLEASDYNALSPGLRELAKTRAYPLAMLPDAEVSNAQTPLAQLSVKAVVGAGAFAQVALVRSKDGRVYALKKMNRDHLSGEKVQQQVLNERFILGLFHHPFISRLEATYKSKLSLYMLLEACMGGELFSQMRKLRRLEEPSARFYGACVVSAFEYMQARGVLYRDLKPENVMVAADGYVRIVDFGFAKRVFTRTYTVCGTPEYLAPELLLMKGHSLGVDWWALGVLLYEMVVGVAPFCFHPETKKPDPDLPPPMLYKNILNPKYELPFPSRLSQGMCEAIEQLLSWDPLTRLGCLTDGAQGVKNHAFFKTLDFSQLEQHKVAPPFKPSLRKDDDLANFEEADQVRCAKFTDEPAYDQRGAWDVDF